jgi:hypothetical protein
MQILEIRNNQRINVDSVEQINLINFAQNLLAWNTITPVYYKGIFAGSEFTVYAATKCYICLKLQASSRNIGGGGWAIVTSYNMANAIDCYFSNNVAYWDVVGAAPVYRPQFLRIENIWFSRLDVATYTDIVFNGYRLNT